MQTPLWTKRCAPSHLTAVVSLVVQDWGGCAHILLPTAVFSIDGDGGDKSLHSANISLTFFHVIWTTVSSSGPISSHLHKQAKRKTAESQQGAVLGRVTPSTLPSLLDRRYEVRPRKHGEQAVPIGGGCLVARASRVSLIGCPAAVHSFPNQTGALNKPFSEAQLNTNQNKSARSTQTIPYIYQK